MMPEPAPEQDNISKRVRKDTIWYCMLAILLLTICVVGYQIERRIRSYPSISVQDFYVLSLSSPSLNNSTSNNSSVFIDLKFEREETLTRPDYAYFQTTLFYGKDRRLPLADRMVEGFSMGRRKRVDVEVAVEAPGLPWGEAYGAVSGGSEVDFMLHLMEIGSGENRVSAARMRVGASGHMVPQNPIEFHYIGSLHDNYT